jgi:hypothetical protein
MTRPEPVNLDSDMVRRREKKRRTDGLKWAASMIFFPVTTNFIKTLTFNRWYFITFILSGDSMFRNAAQGVGSPIARYV